MRFFQLRGRKTNSAAWLPEMRCVLCASRSTWHLPQRLRFHIESRLCAPVWASKQSHYYIYVRSGTILSNNRKNFWRRAPEVWEEFSVSEHENEYIEAADGLRL